MQTLPRNRLNFGPALSAIAAVVVVVVVGGGGGGGGAAAAAAAAAASAASSSLACRTALSIFLAHHFCSISHCREGEQHGCVPQISPNESAHGLLGSITKIKNQKGITAFSDLLSLRANDYANEKTIELQV